MISDNREFPPPLSALQPITCPENPSHYGQADQKKAQRHGEAHFYAHVGRLVEAPAETADKINDRVEQGERAPRRRQHLDRIEGNAVHRGHARPDRGAEDHEIERGGDHGRYHALEQRTKSPRHLELVNGPHTVPVECQWVRSRPHLRSLTKLTKMSSSELWRVFRSLKPMPRSLKRLSKVGIPVRSSWPSKVYSSSHPPAFSAKRQSLSSRGIDASGSSRLSVSCFLPSFFISSIFSSTTISSPLLITPIRSAISSASSM